VLAYPNYWVLHLLHFRWLKPNGNRTFASSQLLEASSQLPAANCQLSISAIKIIQIETHNY
jgi:hypothetical protein